MSKKFEKIVDEAKLNAVCAAELFGCKMSEEVKAIYFNTFSTLFRREFKTVEEQLKAACEYAPWDGMEVARKIGLTDCLNVYAHNLDAMEEFLQALFSWQVLEVLMYCDRTKPAARAALNGHRVSATRHLNKHIKAAA